MTKTIGLLLSFLALAHTNAARAQAHWPQFRGEQARGVAEDSRPPQQWTSPKWKTPIPGLGLSCPVIWGDRIFITTAVPLGRDGAPPPSASQELKIGLYGDIKSVDDNSQHSWQVLCLNKSDGKLLWKQTAHEGVPKVKRHPKSSHANPTPATDGKHLVCFFGAEGLFCYDLDGKLLWKKDFPQLDSGYFAVPDAQWGFASSPVIHDGKVVIQCDVQTNSFIAALDIKDGRELSRTPRADVPTWSTPTIVAAGVSPAVEPGVSPGGYTGPAQAVANGFRHIGGYDLRTGKELWKLGNAGDIPVPTPIVAQGLIFITSAHGKISPIYAIRADVGRDAAPPASAPVNITLKTDETTNSFIAWSTKRGGNYMQTPIVVGDYLFAGRDHGLVTCFTAKTGEQHYSERLGTGRAGFTSSPVSADGKLYFTSEQGTVYVLRAAPKFEILATNELGEPCMATPAIAGDAIFFRTRAHLMCFSN
jgi:outer membrane protein assembly factor BamB